MTPMYQVWRKEADVSAPWGSNAGTRRASPKNKKCARSMPVEQPDARRHSALSRFMEITKSTYFGRTGGDGTGGASVSYSCIAILNGLTSVSG